MGLSRLLVCLSAVALLAACSTVPKNLFEDSRSPLAESDELKNAVQKLNAELDEKICKVDQTNAQQRLLRAHLLIAVVARYGAARVEDYSDTDTVSDATKILGRIQAAQNILLGAWRTQAATVASPTAEGGTNAFYPTHQVDLLISLIELAGAAGGPTVREITRGAISTSPLERIRIGRKLLLNALEDALYKDAYKESCTNLFNRVAKNPGGNPTPADWLDVSVHLNRACTRLQTSSRTTMACLPDGHPGRK